MSISCSARGRWTSARSSTALAQVGYQRGVHVELSRHSHAGVAAVQQSSAFLRPFLESGKRIEVR